MELTENVMQEGGFEDALELGGLEYDVAGAGSVEPGSHAITSVSKQYPWHFASAN